MKWYDVVIESLSINNLEEVIQKATDFLNKEKYIGFINLFKSGSIRGMSLRF